MAASAGSSIQSELTHIVTIVQRGRRRFRERGTAIRQAEARILLGSITRPNIPTRHITGILEHGAAARQLLGRQLAMSRVLQAEGPSALGRRLAGPEVEFILAAALAGLR